MPTEDKIKVPEHCAEVMLYQHIHSMLESDMFAPERLSSSRVLASIVLQHRNSTCVSPSTLTTHTAEVMADLKELRSMVSELLKVSKRNSLGAAPPRKRHRSSVKKANKPEPESHKSCAFSLDLYYYTFSGYICPLDFEAFQQLTDEEKSIRNQELLLPVLHRQLHVLPHSKPYVVYLNDKEHLKDGKKLFEIVSRFSGPGHNHQRPILFVVGRRDEQWNFLFATYDGAKTTVHSLGNVEEESRQTVGIAMFFHFLSRSYKTMDADAKTNLLKLINFEDGISSACAEMDSMDFHFLIDSKEPERKFLKEMRKVIEATYTPCMISCAIMVIILTCNKDLGSPCMASLKYFLSLARIRNDEGNFGMTLVYASLLKEASTKCLKIMSKDHNENQESTKMSSHYVVTRNSEFLMTYNANVQNLVRIVYGDDPDETIQYFCDCAGLDGKQWALDIDPPPTADVLLHDILIHEIEPKASKSEAGNNDNPSKKKARSSDTKKPH